MLRDNNQNTTKRLLIIYGSIMPDIIVRPFEILFQEILKYQTPFHFSSTSLMGITILSYLSSSLITSQEKIWIRFKYIFIGALLHILLDSTLYPWEEIGVNLFYPIPLIYSANWFWSGSLNYLYISFFTILISSIFYSYMNKKWIFSKLISTS